MSIGQVFKTRPATFLFAYRSANRAIRFQKAAEQLSGAVSLPVAGPLAAWMPPRSLHGRIHDVSRKW
ncbi:hypothetical protein XarjCFBP8253_19625 [Xanthomonas arboricola pv. juglandis]|nr:hypothetical protein XarjCFBP8253_19625 [Xanthomonas arboricola pv. juglandis]PPU08751.1 hypothetical protein XacyCFBP2565_20050 [Xanthomonas arboricola pv. corylina]QEX77327.1 hypothetical protein F6Y24_10145 [Xanthomonas arboricola pv. pruni]PPU55939.1 hypothetical protein XacyCFBP1159_20630 [Xanthomonas arboricola pv. corylina]RST70095.1 hypothetical protein EJK96_10570 [Xanthomonas arboricola pv. pruni]